MPPSDKTTPQPHDHPPSFHPFSCVLQDKEGKGSGAQMQLIFPTDGSLSIYVSIPHLQVSGLAYRPGDRPRTVTFTVHHEGQGDPSGAGTRPNDRGQWPGGQAHGVKDAVDHVWDQGHVEDAWPVTWILRYLLRRQAYNLNVLNHGNSVGTWKNSDRVQNSKRLDSGSSDMLSYSCKQHFSRFLAT